MKASLWWFFAATAVLISTNNAKETICEVWYTNTPAASAKSSDLVMTTDAMLPAYAHNAVFLQKDAINWFFVPESTIPPKVTVDGPCDKKARYEIVRNTEDCQYVTHNPDKCACVSIPGIKTYHRVGVKLVPVTVQDGCFFYATDIKVYDAVKNRFISTEVRVLPSDVEAANKRLADLKIVHPFVTTTTTAPTADLATTPAVNKDLDSSSTTTTAKSKTAKAEVGILVICFFSALLIGGAIIGVIVGIDCMLVRIAKNETTRLTSASKGSASTVHTGKLPSAMNQPDKTQQTQTTVESMDTVEKTKEVSNKSVKTKEVQSNKSVKSIKSPKSVSQKNGPKKVLPI